MCKKHHDYAKNNITSMIRAKIELTHLDMEVLENLDCHTHMQPMSLWQCEALGRGEMCADPFQVPLKTTHPNLTSTSTTQSAYGQSPNTATSNSLNLLKQAFGTSTVISKYNNLLGK